jgi:tol-pal system protein YbgF
MNRYSIAAIVLLTLLPFAAPAAAQNKEHQQMEAELRMLQEQNQQLSLALQQATEALKAVNGRIDAAMEAMRKGFADQGLATKNMAGDLSTIAERARDTDTRLRTLGDEITALQTTVTALASTIAQGGAVTPSAVDPNVPPAAVPTTTAPAGGSPLGSIVGQSPGRMLDKAKGDYYSGQYSLAITGFEQLIKQFGNTEAAGEAQYWIGESQFRQKNWAAAVDAYNLVLQKTPRASYAAESSYKRGEAQRQLGDVAAARASYEQTIAQFPGTNAANLAQQRLDGLPKPAGSTPARP